MITLKERVSGSGFDGKFAIGAYEYAGWAEVMGYTCP